MDNPLIDNDNCRLLVFGLAIKLVQNLGKSFPLPLPPNLPRPSPFLSPMAKVHENQGLTPY